MKNILSINGGGSLGYIIAGFCERLESALGCPLYKCFDLIGGVSTGSIIGYCLSNGISAKLIKELYKDLLPLIFKNKRGLISSIFNPYYNIEDLEKELRLILGNANINQTKTKYLTYALEIGYPLMEPVFWKSWKDDEIAYKCLVASSAAPLYFKPYEINNEWYVDGGLASNTPNLACIVEMLKENVPLNDIRLFNINVTVNSGLSSPSKFIGMLEVMRHITSISLWGNIQMQNYQIQKIIQDNFFKIEQCINLPMDTLNFKKMDEEIDRLWAIYSDSVLKKII